MTLLRRPAADKTHVWVVREALLALHAAALRSLAGDDSRRALGRGFLQVLLGGHLGVRPVDVRVERRHPACGGTHRPTVAADLRIRSVHGRTVAFAASPVGIDIELARPNLPWWRVALFASAPRSLDRMLSASPSDRVTAFLEAWTRRGGGRQSSQLRAA